MGFPLPASPWTDELRDEAVALWNAGVSAAQIAKRLGLGLTRCAVIGKIYRAGAPKRETVIKLPYGAVASKRPKRSSDHARARKAAEPFLPPLKLKEPKVMCDLKHAKPWEERAFGECAAPVKEDERGIWSCCAPTDGVYCAFHHARYIVPNKPLRPRVGLRV